MQDRFARRFRRSIRAAQRRYSLNRVGFGMVRLEDPSVRRLLKYITRHMN